MLTWLELLPLLLVLLPLVVLLCYSHHHCHYPLQAFSFAQKAASLTFSVVGPNWRCT